MKKFLAITAIALTALTVSVPAFAMNLVQAKQQGVVGERPDGLLGAVKPSAEATAIIDKINAERMDKYKAIAAKNGTPVRQVQALAGKKLIEQTPSGEYIMNAAGHWQKK